MQKTLCMYQKDRVFCITPATHLVLLKGSKIIPYCQEHLEEVIKNQSADIEKIIQITISNDVTADFIPQKRAKL